jgi:hypothetical protein
MLYAAVVAGFAADPLEFRRLRGYGSRVRSSFRIVFSLQGKDDLIGGGRRAAAPKELPVRLARSPEELLRGVDFAQYCYSLNRVQRPTT